MKEGYGIAGRIAASFIDSKLTPLFIVASLLLGIAAVLMLPREEEPQIKVPMIDVLVSMPGTGSKEIEERVTRPMEQLLWEIPGVEYIYSTSSPGQSLVIVRFEVGSDPEESVVLLNQKLAGNFDRIPHGVSLPLVKLRSIDDVPVLALTLSSERYDHLTLRRLAVQVQEAVKQVRDVSETRVIGGARRQVRVLLDPVRLASRKLSPAGIIPMLLQANRENLAGGMVGDNTELVVETGAFLRTAADVGNVVVGTYGGKPVYLREVAQIVDGAEEPSQYVLHREAGGTDRPAVTLTIAKRPGTNAIRVVREVLERVDYLKGTLIPEEVPVTATRNYAATAAEKSNELLIHMIIAVISVTLLILFALGLRESGIVAIAIPSTLAMTLLVFLLYGYTLNRITLFALIFSIGILVDDAIVVVENIVRHLRLAKNAARDALKIAVEAVDEVGNPTILATFAVIAAVLPMAFVGGLMGPYMRPIPVGASAAMFFSLLIAFVITPWAAIRLLRKRTEPGAGHGSGPENEDSLTRFYRRLMEPLLERRLWRWTFLGSIVALLAGAMALVATGWVKVKMLPFDDKSEFQVILNMPEGSSLESTTRAAREIADVIAREPEVTDQQIYAGTSAPFNFNGLVRHYFMRSGPHVADIQVNLNGRHHRRAKSHTIAKRVRPAVATIADRYGAAVAIAEVPPGPPVLQTLVAEVYGPDDRQRQALAQTVKEAFGEVDGVVDIDGYEEADQTKVEFVIDKEKAALHGISAETISRTLRIAVGGEAVDLLHQPTEKEDVVIRLELPRDARVRPVQLLSIQVRSGDANALSEPGTRGAAPLVALGELVSLRESVTDKSLYHKNLMPVSYVVADVAGAIESPAYAILKLNKLLADIDGRAYGAREARLPVYNAVLPENSQQPALKWDGEWHITLEVFRDLGIAFAAVLVLIYILMVGWFRSFIVPFVVMAAIPFSLVGILPAHAAMGAFFTATSMIGFMAGAGIVVRNSIILVDFIQLRLREGMPLEEAVVDAGAVRFRPMLLTALAVVFGAGVILFDPIFQGLAISLIAGEIASLAISRMAVPVLFYMVHRRRDDGREAFAEGA